MPETRARLDALLVEQGLAESRQKAQALIMSGAVRVRGEVVTKAGTRYAPGADVSVEGSSAYVSRAGGEARLRPRRLRDNGRGTVLPRRRSLDRRLHGRHAPARSRAGNRRGRRVRPTGLASQGRPRVSVMERTNVRHLRADDLPFAPDLLVADLSFISLGVALPGLIRSLPGLVEAVLLVKPQFEAGPEEVGRGGLVRDPAVHERVILSVVETFETLGLGAVGVGLSPVVGLRSGNKEYPLHLLRGRAALDTDGVRRSLRG